MPNLVKRRGHMNRLCATLVACILMTTPLSAQPDETAADSVKPGEKIFQVLTPETTIKMVNLDSRVLEMANRIKIVDGFNSQTISVSALSPYRIRVHADSPGVTSLKMIDEFDSVYTVEFFVEPDTRELQAYLERLFPGTAIDVVGLRDGVVLRGWVTDPTQIPQIIDVAEQFYPSVHSQMNVGGVSQVQLQVKVMEVQRSKIRELGFNFLALGQNYAVVSTPGGIAPLSQFTAPFSGGGPPDAALAPGGSELAFAITGNKDLFTGFLRALQSEALAKVLAEPVLVTTSGRPASMLSGGEFPVLVPQGVGATSIEWREFGVRMEAVPIVLGNGRLRLDIAPEVSARDVSNAVSVDGFVVPGITVRRVNTQVEMRFGETLMIGGLISTVKTGDTQKIPFLGELPWIGAAFSRKTFTEGETELLILVTPQMVAPMSPEQVPAGGPGLHTDTPVDRELYIDGLLEVPLYGPECEPFGPCQDQLIHPSYPSQVPPQLPPNAIIESAQNGNRSSQVQPVSGNAMQTQAVKSAEFNFSTKVDRTSDQQRALPGEQVKADEASTSSADKFGLIEPSTSKGNQEATSSEKSTRSGSWFGK
ncbi:type II and III secretion system protein family protein [Thalassoglobus polymorphus]|uniref:Type II secretion system protein D n=1 Tax=Thalassoglobus polymorphus TaxID=2527994 RepID=A0A517QPD5_9PLAN|nr:hypothetical protein [Thalassoglobus polymorphus]QDT33499.1 Type II secretion system protein D precursor [Thalassoglobus polymorphus]